MTYDDNHDNHHDPVQFALLKAAQVGNICLMRELILMGADTFELDEENLTPLMRAMKLEPERTSTLMLELDVKKPT